MAFFNIRWTVLLVAACVFGCGSATDIHLVADGKSQYAIVVDDTAPPVVRHAATELARYIAKITDVSIPVREVDLGDSTALVMIPEGAKVSALDCPTCRGLGTDGFVIKQQGSNLWVQADGGRGVLYGVYTFLEEYLGCQWFSATVEYVPFRRDIRLRDVYTRQTPAFEYREVYYYDVGDPDFAAKLKLNGSAYGRGLINGVRNVITREHHAGWGLWCHSFHQLVDPELYETHPEYFSFIDGKRVPPKPDGTQLCLTNPDIVPIIVKNLENLIKNEVSDLPIWADTEHRYWSVSQNDGAGFCTCDECHRVDSLEGSHMGSILYAVNQIADYFPDKKIGTLSYTYSRQPPKLVRPRSNVVIQLCNIETSRAGCNVPIANGDLHRKFREDLAEWKAMSDDFLIWDYVVQFQNLVSPFPNFDAFQSNINYYRTNHASGVFLQGNREKGGEFAELRAYVLSKLLWDPEQNVDSLVDTFMKGFYGPAAKPIKQYFDTMHAELRKSGLPLSIDGEPEHHRKGYLSEALVAHYNTLFDQAEKLVADQPALLLRVKEARLPLMYCQLRLRYGDAETLGRVAAEFFDLAEQTDLWMLSEVDWRADQSGNLEMFREKLNKILTR